MAFLRPPRSRVLAATIATIAAGTLAGCVDRSDTPTALVATPSAPDAVAPRISGPSAELPPAPRSTLRRVALGELATPGGTTAPEPTSGTTSLAGGPTSHLVWQNPTTGARVLWQMDAAVYSGTSSSLGTVPTEWSIETAGDLTGDRKSDLFWKNTVTGERRLFVMDGAAYSGVVVLFGIVPKEWDAAAIADFTGDGKADVLWQNMSTGARVIWRMDGTSLASTLDLGTVPLPWTMVGAGDFDGDGKNDVLWENAVTGQRGLWLMDGAMPKPGFTDWGVVPLSWKIAAVADLTGDAKPDVVWQEMSTGQRLVWQMNGIALQTTIQQGFVPLPWEIVAALLSSALPTITNVSPATLRPGTTATITGTNLGGVTTGVSVTVDGVAATVNSVTATSIGITLPAAGFSCSPTHAATIAVTTPGGSATGSAPFAAATQVSLGIGETRVLTDVESACAELPNGGGNRFTVVAYSASSVPNSQTAFRLSGATAGAAGDVTTVPLAQAPAPAATPLLEWLEQAQTQRSEAAHAAVMEKNREALDAMRRRGVVPRRRSGALSSLVALPNVGDVLSFRVPNVNGDLCGTYLGNVDVSARVVYVGTKGIVLEDNTSPLAGTIDATYIQMGQEYDSAMDNVVTANFGSPLVTDPTTNNDGRIYMLFTPLINTEAPNLAGFVASCDFAARNDSWNRAGNFAEIFYARVPTVAGTIADATDNPARWRRTMRSTLVHEVKHIASLGSRWINNGGNWDASWLEEGTARHAEELWARQYVYGNAPFRGNTGYGSSAQPNSMWCDVRPTWPECPDKPYAMQRHFQSLYSHLQNTYMHSPFGNAPNTSFTFYEMSWSLVRYAIDRYGTSDASFLSALVSSGQVGTVNLDGRTGVPWPDLLGRWWLAMALDDHPSLAAAVSNDTRIRTWNLRNIYAGLKSDFPATFTRDYPLVPIGVVFGNFASEPPAALAGGAAMVYELSGARTGGQVLRLQGVGGAGAAPANIRLAIARME